MRTFIAIKFFADTKLIHAVADLKNELAGESIRWVNEEKFHLTLKFLGDTSPQQIAKVKEALAYVAARNQPFTIFSEGLGYFKSSGMPRVLFLNVKEAKALIDVAKEIDEKLASLGFLREKRPFVPHLTLARIKFLKHKNTFFKSIEKYKELVPDPVVIREIYYFQSILTPAGPEYTVLARYPLKY